MCCMRDLLVFVKFTTFYNTGKDLATFDSNCLTDIPLLVKASKLARFFSPQDLKHP